MKKLLISLFLSCYILTAVSTGIFAEPAADHELVVDNANLLNIEEKEKLTARLTAFNNAHNFDIVILTVENTDSKTNTAFADDFYDFNNYGRGSDFDGMLLLINMNPRSWHISTSGKGIEYFTDYGIQKIGEYITPSLSEDKYSTAFNEYLDISEKFLAQAENGKPFDIHNPYKSSKEQTKIIIILLICALVIALVSVGIMAMTMNTARKQVTAKAYQKKLNLTNSQDIYLYSRTTSRTIETSNGGSRSSGGSRSHTSSSGRRHGGGGGRF